jgi:hypothetical protein
VGVGIDVGVYVGLSEIVAFPSGLEEATSARRIVNEGEKTVAASMNLTALNIINDRALM